MHNRNFLARGVWLALLGMFLLAVTTSSGFAQSTNASLTGTISDPTGAVILGAKLTLTNIATGFQVNFVSDASGEFSFHNLTPGKYDLSATAVGFKSSTQKGIELAINQTARVDVHLPLGASDETVTVIGDASLINYENPTLQGGVAPETLQDFPMVVSGAPRSSVAVAILMPGVTTGGGGTPFNARLNGGIVSGDEALVDGGTMTEGFMSQTGMTALQTDFGMSPDITSEVKILTANYDAQYGNSTSGQLVIVTKSGSEQFHGAGYEYLRNDALNASQYGASNKTSDKENDYGANIGGPIYLPKFHGKNSFLKGYFYFNWEGFKDHGGASSSTLSIASLADREGNFSAAGSQLYYPNDSTKYGTDAGTPIAYKGVTNQINPKYEDSVAKAWMAAMPTPTNSAEVNNYFIPKAGQGSLTNSENVYFWRTDFNVGQKDHLYYTYWWQYSGINTNSNLPKDISTAMPASPENAPIQRFNWEHNFSDVMTNHLTLGYFNRNEGYFSLNAGANLPSVPGVANTSYLPEFLFGGGYSQLGNTDGPSASANKTTRGTYALNDVVTRVIGKHTVTGGIEWHKAGSAIHHAQNQGGTFTFNADTTGNTACLSSSCPGDAMASFYLGAAAVGNVNYYNVPAEYPRQSAWAVHFGDSWRKSSKLTVNYSLRWDYIAPMKEKYDNLSFFDPNGLNPDAITSSGTELSGRLAFAGKKWGAASYGAEYPEVPFKKGFGPRVGFAYSVSNNTVIRAGYGIYFGQGFYPGWAGGMSQDGFNKSVTLNESATGTLERPALYLEDGISSSQVGQTKNISSGFDNGTTPSMYRPLDANRRPYSSQWNFTIEQQLPHNFFGSVSYVGTKGTHLPSALTPLNVLNPNNPSISSLSKDVLSTSYNSANGPSTFATAGVSAPYLNWTSQMTGCSPTVAQALLPYPQYCGTMQGLNENHATSIYQSFQGRIERHMTNGLYLLGSLTVQKLYTDASFTGQSNNEVGNGYQGNNGAFSPYDKSRAWAIAQDNVPVTVSVAVVYDLPFGAGKPFLNQSGIRPVVSGWQVSPLYRYEWGTPFSFYSSSCPTATAVPEFRESCIPGQVAGQQALLHGRNGYKPGSGKYLNPSAFETDFSSFGYTGQGKAVSTIYGPSFKNLDISLTKNTKIAGKGNFKFTANFFNAFNNHYFIDSQGSEVWGGSPVAFVTDVAASGNSFGTWNGSVSTPRTIQFAGRIEF